MHCPHGKDMLHESCKMCENGARKNKNARRCEECDKPLSSREKNVCNNCASENKKWR